MVYDNPDIIIRHITTKNKVRKIVSYKSYECDLYLQHRKIDEFIKSNFIPSKFTKGYVKGQSIYENALAHMYNDYFILLDIKDFFPHICHKQLADKVFHELNWKDKNQISKKESIELVKRCSVNSRGLPLGFITSPVLSNIYLKEFDCIFFSELNNQGLNRVIYTRYADDLIISFKTDSTMKDLPVEHIIVDKASKLLSRYGLRLNRDKIRSYNLNISNHVKITGINITKTDSNYRHLTVGRSIKDRLFWDAINASKSDDYEEKQKIKGIQSFILSVEKQGYESCYSNGMINLVHSLGYGSLKELIDSF